MVTRLGTLNEARLAKIEEPARECLQRLADITAAAEGRQGEVMPDIGLMGLRAQFSVVGNDVIHRLEEDVRSSCLPIMRQFKKELDSL